MQRPRVGEALSQVERLASADKPFQLMWAMLHSYAVMLALVASVMHAGSASYHFRRFRHSSF